MQFYWVISILTFMVQYALCNLPNADKIYEPNPPTTHRVTMVIEYTPEGEIEVRTGEISIAIFGTVVPKTAENFVKIASGIKAKVKGKEDETLDVSYRGTLFHRIEKGQLIQGGNVLPNIGSFSIYGQRFADENFELKHDRAGRVSMANAGKNSNASQFFIVTDPNGLEDLNGKHVVFGQVVSGLDILLLYVQNVNTIESKPSPDVKIVGCSVDTMMLGDKEGLHARYLEDLKKFREGDNTIGATLKTALGGSAASALAVKGRNDGSWSTYKYLYAAGAVFGVLYLVKKRRSIFSRSSANVVSVRNS